MGILERKIIHGGTTLCSHIDYPEFVLPRHKHIEYELMLFTRGSGKEFVGEGTADYREGDIAFIGSNVPHLHLCDAKLDPEEGHEPSAGEALQFDPRIFPQDIDSIPDYRPIADLLHKSQYGIRFYDRELFEELKECLSRLDGLFYTKRLIVFLHILDKLTLCKETNLLSPTPYNNANSIQDANEPINRVYAYLYNHFKEKFTLEDVARYVRQNSSALCRYFKKRTDKSIFGCLAEIRVEHASKLLTYSNLTVAQVAYESGYNHVPYFIKQFRDITGLTPKEYRQQNR